MTTKTGKAIRIHGGSVEWGTSGALPHTREQATTTQRLSFLIYRCNKIQGYFKQRGKSAPVPVTWWASSRGSYLEMYRPEFKGVG